MHRVKLTKCRADLTKPDATGIRTVEQNNGPEGTGHGLVPPVPFGSMWMICSHLPPGARTRWVTERIASMSHGSRGKRSAIKRRNNRFEYAGLLSTFSAAASSPKIRNWERKLFYLLTSALMGDPFSSEPHN